MAILSLLTMKMRSGSASMRTTEPQFSSSTGKSAVRASDAAFVSDGADVPDASESAPPPANSTPTNTSAIVMSIAYLFI